MGGIIIRSLQNLYELPLQVAGKWRKPGGGGGLMGEKKATIPHPIVPIAPHFPSGPSTKPSVRHPEGGSMVGSDRLNVPAIDNSSH